MEIYTRKIGGPPLLIITMGKYVDHHLLGISWDIMRQDSKLLVETIKIIHIYKIHIL